MNLDERPRFILNKLVDVGILRPVIKASVLLKYEGFEEVDDSLLNDLVNKGLLKRNLEDKLLACPKCGSISILTKYICPRCGSLNLDKTKLIQHVDCGYTNSEVKFLRSGNTLVCPKCSKEVNERNTKIYAQFFECTSCGFKTPLPNIVHICGDCGNIFKPIDTVLKPIYSYELSSSNKELVKR